MKLSVITINYNNRDGLRRTIESVLCQTTRDLFEYIIIDGSSTDGSVEVIHEFADRVDYWVSEPDKGIYNAMNKGTFQAKGEYCLYLNSGDWLIGPSSLDFLRTKTLTADIITVPPSSRIKELKGLNKYSVYYIYRGSFHHQNTLINKALLERMGGYNEGYRAVSDWEFFMKLMIFISPTIDDTLMQFAQTELAGISATDIIGIEGLDVKNRLFPYITPDIDMLSMMRKSRLVRLAWAIVVAYSKFKQRISL